MADYYEGPVAPNSTVSGVAALLTPINIILLTAAFGLVYVNIRRPAVPLVLAKPPPPILYRVYTPRQLLPFNGKEGRSVFLAIRGKVFDVTPGRNFYGPNGPYANFAGRDASRGLACGSFDEDMLTEDLDGPLDTLEDLGSEEMEALIGWEQTFNEKYLVVGELVPAGSPKAQKD